MLDMIKARTQGNISEDENRMLEHILRELKLNFVDELDKEKKEKAASQEKTGEPPAQG
jgi:ribosome recycling factor